MRIGYFLSTGSLFYQKRVVRNLLGQFATGVTVITTRGKDGRKIGMTANSFSSLSLDPPLILWSLSKTAPSLPDFVEAEYFAIHMLAQEHHQLSGHFARGAEDKFAGIAHQQCATEAGHLLGANEVGQPQTGEGDNLDHQYDSGEQHRQVPGNGWLPPA